MNDRVAELEIRLSFQDKALQDLNDVVVRQQREIDRLANEVDALKARLHATMPSLIATEAEETPPPHY